MELFSQSFVQAVHQLLSGSRTVILGTIPVSKGKPLGLVEEIRNRKEVKVFNVSHSNKSANCDSTHWGPGRKDKHVGNEIK